MVTLSAGYALKYNIFEKYDSNPTFHSIGNKKIMERL